MKKLILFSLLFLIGCSTPKLTTTTKISTVYDTITESYYNDTTIYIRTSLTRQQRKSIKDSMNHVEFLAKFTIRQLRKMYSDSLDYEIDKSKIEKKMYKDSLKFSKRSLRIVTDAYSDSLKYAKLIHNKAVTKTNQVAVWWVWALMGILIFIIIVMISKKALP